MTITCYSPSTGQTYTLNIGCEYGGSYRLRREHNRSDIKKYLSTSSLTSINYKLETTTFYDCTTKFMSDAEAIGFARDFMGGMNFQVTCAEDSLTNEPAILASTSAPTKSNIQDGVVSYDFTIQISTVQTIYI